MLNRKLLRSMFGLALALTSLGATAQVSGTKNIPGDYATLAAAITDLNSVGVGAGGVTLNLLAGNPQTTPAGGYAITATGTLADPITVACNGNTITAFTPQTSGALNDAIFKLIGADYVTINGCVMTEDAANTTTTAGSNNMTEWGIALLYASTTDGAQNATLQGNTITLNRTYQNTFGIYSNSTHSATAVSTSATATSAAGGNSGLKIYGNTISNVNIGIVVVGPTAAADHNEVVDIGGVALATGNTVTNYGTTGTFSGYANVSGTVNGILVRNSRNYNVSFNTVTSSVGGVTAGTLNGIHIPAASVAPAGTMVNSITNNNLSLRSGVAGGAMNGILVAATTGTLTSTVSINNNNFSDTTHTVAGSAAIVFISYGSPSLNQTINNNTFTNMSVNTTGSVTFIAIGTVPVPATGSMQVNGNAIVTGFAKTGAGGTVAFYTNNASPVQGALASVSNNIISNITVTGATGFTGISSTDGASGTNGPTKTISGNTISTISGGTGTMTPMTVNFSGPGTIVSANAINNISWGAGATALTLGTSNQSTTATENTINTILTTAGVVNGISTGTATVSVARNKIHDLQSTNATGSVNGLLITAGTAVTAANNLIGDLRAPSTSAANAVIGISVTGGTTVNAAYNTVRLQASSVGADFGTSAVSAATGTTLALNNNVLVNLSTAAGTGLTVAYRRSSATLTSYASSSNHNDFFAGAPSAANLIFFDGTNSDQTLADYKTRVATRDSASVSENPPFLSTAGSSANFLHIDPAIATQLESGGAPFAGVSVDFDGDARNASTPDIGADEFNGILLDLNGPTIAYALLGSTTQTSNRTLNATITDPSGVAVGANAPRVYFRKNAGSYFSTQCTGAGPVYTCTIDNALIGGVVASDVIDYFVIAQDTAGNVSANPGAGLVATDVNTVSTPPTTPNTYTIVAPFPASVNVGAGETFTSLTNAGGLFEALNAGVLTANVTALVTSDLAAETGGVALNPFAENGVGGYTLTIAPSAASERLIVGAAAGGLIRLNGADRVTFDGRFNGSGRFLRIRNTAAGATFLFINDATLNTVASSIVESANTVATSGSIFFSTSTGSLGNSGNEIRDCELRDRSDAAGVPANAVYSNGTAGAPNTSNSLLQSSVYNYTANGVLVAVTGAGNGWTVADNSFYQTAARTTALSGVTLAGGSGHSVIGNSIGGSAAGASGAFLATTGLFNGINLTVGTATATSVQGNVVKNIRSTSTSFTASYGIWVQAGTVNVGNVLGNYIGSADPNERFEINGDSYGIRVVSTTTANVSNNTVNNMTTGPTVPTGEFYFGIAVEGVAGAHTVQNNLVTNFTNGSTPDASFNTQTIGMIVSATGAQTIRGNTIDTIGNTSIAAVATLNNRVWGTILSGTGVGTVYERNRIVGVYASSPTTGARADVVTALQIQTLANATLSNNMVSVAGGAASDRSIFGILDLNAAGPTTNYFFNSVNVYGTATTANNSFAFNRNGVGTVVLRNNIFANTRSGGTGFHVALANSNPAATGWSATASDYNVVFNATPAHVTQWLGSAAINNLTLADFRTASGGDANSLSGDPLFVSDSDLHIGPTSPAANVGIPFGGVTIDFDLDTRSATTPDIGADELPTYTVGGSVSGLVGAGLVLQNNLGDDLPISSNGSFTFATALSPGAAYSVTVLNQPSNPTQTCVVTNGSGTIAAANVTDVAVSCTTNTYTVGGTVSGLTGTGLVLQNSGGDNLPISGNGSFTFATPVASGGAYAVTVFAQPGSPTQTCVVTNGSGSVGNANVTDVAVNCTTNTYSVGGTVTGLTGTGLVLRNNGGDDLPISGNGPFTFATPVASGGAYAVTVFAQPGSPTQTCVVTNGSGGVSNANVTNVAVNCTTNTYTVGGTVSGLTGTGLVLQNNGGDNLPISGNGAFTFATPVASGSAYAVSVFTQPGSPAQICTVGGASGTVGGANVTNVAVTCATNTYTVGGNVTGLTGSGLVLRNNGGDNLSIAGNGAFTFATPVASGAAYAVTVFAQPTSPAQTCTVTNGSGTVGSANVTDVAVACSDSNAAPTITAVGVTRRAGDAGAVSTIANVTDAEDALNTLAVTVNGGATATVNSVTVSAISTSVAGVVSANVVAACGATSASFTLRVTDSGALFNESTLSVTVDPNLAPTLTYAAANAVFGQNLSVNPATGPSDSGSISTIVVQGAGTYTGGVTVNNATGVVGLTNAAPVGAHTIVIRATDNCALTTDASLALTVGQAATTTAITAQTLNPTFAGQSFTVSYTVTANAPGAGTPAGDVTVSDGVDSCTATVAVGQCSLALSTPGARTLTATYAGNASFSGSAGTAAHTVSPTANLSITKTVNDALLGTGVIQYTITVANAGPSPAIGATVVDNFPATVTGVTWTCAGSGGGACSGSGGGNINQLANLPVGATVVYSITGSVALPLPNSISNTATVAAPAGTTDPDTANNTSTAVAVVIIFRDGFEDVVVTAPVAEKLQFAANGAYASLQLPLGDIAPMPVNQEPVEVIRFALADSLVVVQTRRLGDLIQVRSLQVNADRSWTAGTWTSLDSAGALYFEWAAGNAAQPGAMPMTRLRTQR